MRQQGGTSRILCLAWSYHPPPEWGPWFLQTNSKVLWCVFLEEEPGPKGALLCPGCSSLVFASHLFSHCCYLIAKSCPTWTTTCQAFLSFTISRSLLKLMSVMLSNHLILRHPLLLLSSIFPSIRIFSNESAFTIKEPKYWHFSINTSNEYARLISFRIDRFDFLAIPGTVKNLLQHHNLKASMLQHSAFLMIKLSHRYMTTGKTIALTRWIFVAKVISLIFNKLSRIVI